VTHVVEGLTIYAYDDQQDERRDEFGYVIVVDAFYGRPKENPIVPPELKVPLYRRAWGYGTTEIAPARVAAFVDEVKTVLPVFKARGLEQAVKELDDVISLAERARGVGLGLIVYGP
jgi:hypothetical protein